MSAQPFAFDLVHSTVGFTVRHMIVSKVHGRFGKWTGTFLLDEADLTKSSVEIHIDAASIDTNVTDRDNHLRSPDFFDVQKFPELVFKSARVEKVSGDNYKLIGNLTIHGVTKEVTLDTEFNGITPSPFGDVRAGFSAKTSVNRGDYGLHWNKAIEAGGVVVGEKIDINIEIEASRPAVAKAV